MGVLQDYLNSRMFGMRGSLASTGQPGQQQYQMPSPVSLSQISAPSMPQTSATTPVQMPQQPSGYGLAQMGGQRVSLADIGGSNDPFRRGSTGNMNVVNFAPDPNFGAAERYYNDEVRRAKEIQDQWNLSGRGPIKPTIALQDIENRMRQQANDINMGYLQRKLSEPSEFEKMNMEMMLKDRQSQSDLERDIKLQELKNKGLIDAAGTRSGIGNLKKGERINASGEAELIPGSDIYIKNSRMHGKDVATIKGLDTYTSNANMKIDSILSSPAFSKLFGGYNAYITNKFPGETQDVKAKLESLKSDLKKAGLEIMRSGGSIGMMTEREWPIVEQLISTLDPKMSEEAATNTLGQIKSYLESIRKNALDTYNETWSGTQFLKDTQNSEAAPGGVTSGRFSVREAK